MERRCLAIVGATCTGKSSLALKLACRLRGEIVNADALQIYRGFDKGTAKPDAEQREQVPHHLIDILEPGDAFSAGEFAVRARGVILEILGRGCLPIVVGGSGFYLRALFEGLSSIPPVPKEIRQILRERVDTEGLGQLFEELRERDPDTARRLVPTDRQRLLRALEVIQVTGKPLSEWQRGERRAFCVDAIRIGLTLPRSVLYDRIGLRAHQMLKHGWLEEVRGLVGKGVPESAPAFQAIGYRQLLAYLQGGCTLVEAVEDTIQATCRYAKRQETWFRKEPAVAWFQSYEEESLTGTVFDYLVANGIRGRQ